MSTETIRERNEIPSGDKWNLDRLFTGEDTWEEGFTRLQGMIDEIGGFQGKLGQSAGQMY